MMKTQEHPRFTHPHDPWEAKKEEEYSMGGSKTGVFNTPIFFSFAHIKSYPPPLLCPPPPERCNMGVQEEKDGMLSVFEKEVNVP